MKNGIKKENVTVSWNNKGDIIIGNYVWIGYEAVIMAGVTKDVPPYTIVGGVPAKIIRKRFSEQVISQLLEIKWWDWEKNKIKVNIEKIKSGDIESIDK